jgi:Transglycosylase SLT domain
VGTAAARSPRRVIEAEPRPANGVAATDPALTPRHVLGLAILLLAMVPAYLTVRPANGRMEVLDTEVASVAEAGDTANDPGMSTVNMLEIHAHIREVAARYQVSPRLVAAVIEAESEFNPRAVSRKGARGLMQLMPATASSLQVENSFDPFENIEGGVRHLRRLIDRFDGNLPLAIAAYNAGEQAVVVHGGIPPYRETRRYVARILRRIGYVGIVATPAGPGRTIVAVRATPVASAPSQRPSSLEIRPAVQVEPPRMTSVRAEPVVSPENPVLAAEKTGSGREVPRKVEDMAGRGIYGESP